MHMSEICLLYVIENDGLRQLGATNGRPVTENIFSHVSLCSGESIGVALPLPFAMPPAQYIVFYVMWTKDSVNRGLKKK